MKRSSMNGGGVASQARNSSPDNNVTASSSVEPRKKGPLLMTRRKAQKEVVVETIIAEPPPVAENLVSTSQNGLGDDSPPPSVEPMTDRCSMCRMSGMRSLSNLSKCNQMIRALRAITPAPNDILANTLTNICVQCVYKINAHGDMSRSFQIRLQRFINGHSGVWDTSSSTEQTHGQHKNEEPQENPSSTRSPESSPHNGIGSTSQITSNHIIASPETTNSIEEATTSWEESPSQTLPASTPKHTVKRRKASSSNQRTITPPRLSPVIAYNIVTASEAHATSPHSTTNEVRKTRKRRTRTVYGEASIVRPDNCTDESMTRSRVSLRALSTRSQHISLQPRSRSQPAPVTKSGASVSSYYQRKRHRSQPPQLACDNCERIYKRKDHYAKHLVRCHEQDQNTNLPTTAPPPVTLKKGRPRKKLDDARCHEQDQNTNLPTTAPPPVTLKKGRPRKKLDDARCHEQDQNTNLPTTASLPVTLKKKQPRKKLDDAPPVAKTPRKTNKASTPRSTKKGRRKARAKIVRSVGPRVYHCMECAVTVKSLRKLREHKKIHMVRYNCPTCCMNFTAFFDYEFHKTICMAKHEVERKNKSASLCPERLRMTRSISRARSQAASAFVAHSTFTASTRPFRHESRYNRIEDYDDDDDDDDVDGVNDDDDDVDGVNVDYDDHEFDDVDCYVDDVDCYVDDYDNDVDGDDVDGNAEDVDDDVSLADTNYTKRMCYTGYWVDDQNSNRTESLCEEICNVNNRIATDKEYDLYLLNRYKAQMQTRKFCCLAPDCKYTPDDLIGLLLHDYSQHFKSAWYYCKKCSHVFTSKVFLDYHLDRQDSGNFVCYRCTETFEFQHQLDCHLISHTKYENYRCHYCELEFLSELELNQHCIQRNHMGVRSVIGIERDMTIVNETPPERPVAATDYKVTVIDMKLPPSAKQVEYKPAFWETMPQSRHIGKLQFNNQRHPNCWGWSPVPIAKQKRQQLNRSAKKKTLL